MYNAATKLRLSEPDQENLALKIEKWKIQYPDNEIFFRGYRELDKDETRTVEVDEEAEDEKIKVWRFFTWSLDFTCEICSKGKK